MRIFGWVPEVVFPPVSLSVSIASAPNIGRLWVESAGVDRWSRSPLADLQRPVLGDYGLPAFSAVSDTSNGNDQAQQRRGLSELRVW